MEDDFKIKRKSDEKLQQQRLEEEQKKKEEQKLKPVYGWDFDYINRTTPRCQQFSERMDFAVKHICDNIHPKTKSFLVKSIIRDQNVLSSNFKNEFNECMKKLYEDKLKYMKQKNCLYGACCVLKCLAIREAEGLYCSQCKIFINDASSLHKNGNSEFAFERLKVIFTTFDSSTYDHYGTQTLPDMNQTQRIKQIVPGSQLIKRKNYLHVLLQMLNSWKNLSQTNKDQYQIAINKISKNIKNLEDFDDGEQKRRYRSKSRSRSRSTDRKNKNQRKYFGNRQDEERSRQKSAYKPNDKHHKRH